MFASSRRAQLLVLLAVLGAIAPAVPDVARPLPLSAVRLTGGPLRQAQELDAGGRVLGLRTIRP